MALSEANALAVVKDAHPATTTYVLDAQGRTLGEELPDGHTETWLRDANGLVDVAIDQDLNRTTYTYDSLGDPTSIESFSGTVYTAKSSTTIRLFTR